MNEHNENVELMKDLRSKLDAVDSVKTNKKSPDPVAHLYISLTKSVIRIGAGVFLCAGLFVEAGALLVVAELLGIVEELV
jgi:hypothetical protein